jgi:hypothetical protein
LKVILAAGVLRRRSAGRRAAVRAPQVATGPRSNRSAPVPRRRAVRRRPESRHNALEIGDQPAGKPGGPTSPRSTRKSHRLGTDTAAIAIQDLAVQLTTYISVSAAPGGRRFRRCSA